MPTTTSADSGHHDSRIPSSRTEAPGRVVIVDDDLSMCELLSDVLTAKRYEVRWYTDPSPALAEIERGDYDAVVTDLQLGTANGLDLCGAIHAAYPNLPVVLMTAFGNMDAAVAALRARAYDFLSKPIDIPSFELTISRAVAHRQLQREVKRLREATRQPDLDDFVGDSQPMLELYDLIQRLSDSEASVLVCGESGSGKELVARALHQLSRRADGPFVPVNCAAVPHALLESMLFGHVKGAFTDAKSDRDGLFVEASGGTLFLDEIGEMPLEMQSKLLRVLQDRQVRPVGGSRQIEFDCRIVTATNRDLTQAIEAGEFREDLFYRINVVNIDVPPLRRRGNDILVLAQHFLDEAAARGDKDVRGITSDAAKQLLDYDWPGNVRELRNAMERAVALTRRQEIAPEDLPPAVLRGSLDLSASAVETDIGTMLTIDELERKHIRRVLELAEGNKTKAAEVLGIDRRTLYRKLARFEAATA